MPVFRLLNCLKINSLHRTTHYTDKPEIWHEGVDVRSPCHISRLSVQNCGNTASKTVKIWNFAHKFAHERRLVCTKFHYPLSVCVRLQVAFYRATHMHSADYAVARWQDVCPFVRPSVCPSHAGIISKRL